MFAGVRPPRLAILVDINDDDWQNTCQRVIECLSTIWGGKYSIIIPTDGNEISNHFWKLLEAFDPDYICEYLKTGLDLKLSRPAEFEDLVKSYVECEFPKGNPSQESIDSIRKQLAEGAQRQLPITEQLQARLIRVLAPFHFENELQGPTLYARWKVQNPLTRVSSLLGKIAHPVRMFSPSLSITNLPPLWASAILGASFQEQDEEFTSNGVKVDDKVAQDLLPANSFSALLSGSFEDLRICPFAFTMLGLSYYQPPNFRRAGIPIVIIIGETLKDFSLYFGLSRIQSNVFWLLPNWLNDFSEAQQRASSGGSRVEEHERYAQRFGEVILKAARHYPDACIEFLSLSFSDEDLNSYMDKLDQAAPNRFGPSIRNRSRVGQGLHELRQSPRVVFNTDNFATPTTQQVFEGKTSGFFPTPKPKGFTRLVPQDHRWISEIRSDRFQYPRHPSFGRWLLQHHLITTTDARSGAKGICYSALSPICIGGDVDSNLIQPEIRVPSAGEVFEHAARSAALTTNTSDKGFMSADTIRRVGGLENAAAMFKNPQMSAILNRFENKNNRKNTPNSIFLKSDGRHYLKFSAFVEIFKDAAKASLMVDRLLTQEVLHRGTILKCSFCRNTDWFYTKEFSHSFNCKRCRREQTALSKQTLGEAEPRWYYQLDEIVFQAIHHNCFAPILALDALRHRSKVFAYADEMEVRRVQDPKHFVEVDLWCICDGILTIGEAKVADRMAKSNTEELTCLSNYLEVAIGLGARRFILATTDEWSVRTIDNANSVFKSSGISVEVFESAEMMSN